MDKTQVTLNGISFPLYSVNTLIIGSGAAALNAAVRLHGFGQEDILIITDQWGGGTSNNTGSDKQTYYKLSLSGEKTDSVREMAKDLYNGGCMHGDIALCEVQSSARVFFHLVELGVPFPHDRFGAYVGYKTDHDPRGRATSAGPLTSHYMFQCLAKEVVTRGIQVLDRLQVIALLAEDDPAEDTSGGQSAPSKRVTGAIALDIGQMHTPNRGFVIINAVNVVLGTGGPAGIYKTSVYPESQTGSTGLALEIGAAANNLTESQYGIASISFRWNLSGTYQQVIPRYISMDPEGGDEKEFLNDFFPDTGKLATAIFLKGYQWPFDPDKVAGYGSSLIDILVYQETVLKGRRVFLDFTRNPSGTGRTKGFSLKLLDPEAYAYLEKSGALLATPIQRLKKMNQPAVDLYKNHGIDIEKQLLEIAVCAQHNNGGLAGNIWWESTVRHLFPVGEVNGTHGVKRPGGSALNSGQVGSLRAALFISRRYREYPPDTEKFLSGASGQIRKWFDLAGKYVEGGSGVRISADQSLSRIQERMSSCGAHIRKADKVAGELKKAREDYAALKENLKVNDPSELPKAFRVLDLCLTHVFFLEAIHEYLGKGGGSRGSYMVLDPKGILPCESLGQEWKMRRTEKDAFVSRNILELRLDREGRILKEWVPVRPIPEEDTWFENVWNQYLKDEIVK